MSDTPLSWIDARSIGVDGRAFTDTEAPFDRLPRDARGRVSDAVWALQRNTAGLCVRFVTDAPEIGVRWSLTSPSLGMDHMPATGVSGVDLYAAARGAPRYVGTGRPTEQRWNLARLGGSQDGTPWTFTLDFPLYNGVSELEVGVPAGHRCEPAGRAGRTPPVCFYGTSIVQGGCATRPGMAYPAIIGRQLDVECVNLGFSGAGRAEPEMAEILSRVDARAWVLDPLPNMAADTIVERLGNLVRSLRRAHPDVPLVLVEHVRPSRLTGPAERPWAEEWSKTTRFMTEVVNSARADGVTGITVVPWTDLVGDDFEATVDGIHPTDLGFQRMAAAIGPAVREAISGT
jgi:hypothetical protein